MKKQLVCTVLASMLLTNPITALCASECTAEVDKDTEVVKITADTQNAKKDFVVTVLNPDSVLDEISENKSALQNQRIITSDESGNLSYSFKLNLNDENNSGTYKVYIFGRSIDEPIYTEFFYASKQETDELISAIFAAESENDILAIISDEMNAKILAVDTFKPFTEGNKTKISQLIFKSLKQSTMTQYTAGEMQKIILKASLIAAFNDGKTELVTADDGTFLYEDILEFDSLDEDFDVTFADIFKNTVSTEGKKAIQHALMNKNYASLDELKKDFMVQTCLIGLTNPQKSGFAHVEKILTQKNAEKTGLKLSKALSDNDAMSIAKEKSYATIKALQNKIDSLGESKGSGTSGGSSGKGSSTSSGIGSFTIDRTNEPNKNNDTAAEEKKFSDLAGYEWAQDAIYDLCKRNIINGIDNNSFAPDKLLTREQAAKIICEALPIESSGEKTAFSDVNEDDWFADFVYKAYSKGIIKGISDTEFGTGRNITRQDFAAMIYRAFGFSPESTNKVFEDDSEIGAYAKEAVDTLCSKGLINGYEDNSFRPNENCTRAEAAMLIYRVLKEMGA